jgi:two-component system sensor histidine kinase MprB
LEEVDAVLRRLAILLASMGAGGIALAGLLGWGVARASLKPVRRMTGVTETVTETGDLAARIHVPGRGRDELGRLAASFNRMMDALEASIRTQRQLLADASHELRTPLTSLRTNIEVLASAERLSEGDRDRLMADVGEQLEELSHLVADILELARDGEAPPKVEDVALDDLVRRAVDRVRSRAPHLTFATDLHPSVVVGVPGRLDRAVSNLLDNAAKWSPPGAPVEVSVADGAVVVRDHGPGIAEDDLPRVFDRFYRAPAARAMPGSGLGLAIVRQIAESHGGTVSAATAPDGGTVLRLELLAAS